MKRSCRTKRKPFSTLKDRNEDYVFLRGCVQAALEVKSCAITWSIHSSMCLCKKEETEEEESNSGGLILWENTEDAGPRPANRANRQELRLGVHKRVKQREA